jgi:hypothetical protein
VVVEEMIEVVVDKTVVVVGMVVVEPTVVVVVELSNDPHCPALTGQT